MEAKMNISKRSLFLLIADQAAILAAYSFAGYIYTGELSLVPNHMYQLVAALVFPLAFYIADLYFPYKIFTRSKTFAEVVLGVAVGAIILAAAAYFDRSFTTSRLIFSYMAAALILLVYGIRLFYDILFGFRFMDKKAIVIGSGPLALRVAETLKGTRNSGIELAGFVSEGRKNGKGTSGIEVLGNISNLVSLIDWYKIQLVIMAIEPKENVSEVDVLSQVLRKQVTVTSGMHLLENLTGAIPYELIDSHYLLGLMSEVRVNRYLRVKRLIDLIFGTALSVVLFPVLAAALLLLILTGHGKPFFVQKRIGRGGKPFNLVKLRSMSSEKGKPKVTKIGKWLRKYRIDEIPQLWNVIRGEMSLIGPRPEIPYFVERSRKKTPFYDTIFSIKPGLTGWAQINFRYTTTVKEYNEKFRYNLYYLKNISLILDFVILLRTVRVVLLGKGK